MVILKDKNGTKFVESRTVSKNDALKLTMEIGHQPGVESSLITDSEDRAMTADESRLQKLIGDKLGMYGTRDGSKDFQVDDATVDSHKEVIFTGGTVQFATSGEMESVEFDNSTGDVDWTLTKPIRMGKWEYWNFSRNVL